MISARSMPLAEPACELPGLSTPPSNRFDAFSAVPASAITSRINTNPFRPLPRPQSSTSPAIIAGHRDPFSPVYDPLYSDALEAAAQSSIPVNGAFEQTGQEQRSSHYVVTNMSRQPSERLQNLQPSYIATVQLGVVAFGGSSPLAHQPIRRSPLSFPPVDPLAQSIREDCDNPPPSAAVDTEAKPKVEGPPVFKP